MPGDKEKVINLTVDKGIIKVATVDSPGSIIDPNPSANYVQTYTLEKGGKYKAVVDEISKNGDHKLETIGNGHVNDEGLTKLLKDHLSSDLKVVLKVNGKETDLKQLNKILETNEVLVETSKALSPIDNAQATTLDNPAKNNKKGLALT